MQSKLLAQKTCHSMMVEYFIKYKAMKEFLLGIDIITNLSKEEIIKNNTCQMSFLDKFIEKKCW